MRELRILLLLRACQGPGARGRVYIEWGGPVTASPPLKEGHAAVSPAVATETRGWGGGWRPLAWLAAWAGEQGDVTAIGTPHGRFTWKPVLINKKTQPDAGGPFPPRSGNHNNQGE